MVSLREARRTRNLTIKELSQLSGVCVGTINRIERDSRHKVHETTAEHLAKAVELPVEKLFDASRRTDQGRPALTGGKYTTSKESVRAICEECYLEISDSGTCGCS